MKTKSKILKEIEKEMLKEKGVKKLGLFGSYAKGKQKKGSDVDILIKVEEDLSITDLVEIQIVLEKKLKKKVDLIEYSYLHPLIKKQALKEEIRII